MSQLECLTGAWDEAVNHVQTGEEIVVQAGQPANTAFLLASRALVEAHLGRTDSVRAAGEAALELANRTNAALAQSIARWGLGLLALSLEHPEDAHAHLGPLVAEARAARFREPGEMRFVPDDVEALVDLGQLEEAEAELAWFEQYAASSDRASARAAAARCHGLIASARTEHPSAALASRKLCVSTTEFRCRSSVRGRCSPSAAHSGDPEKGGQHASLSSRRSRPSSSSVRQSGRRERAQSSGGSPAAHPAPAS